ncbi:unnamed protein product [Heligmosomoides polygyrus]|uniref:Tubulin domain-containing protein n=1 Tax=Heligmosomoides polygyrus TaxID=6339 RepID=A0A183FNG2_HELPZ|nr:unnamed protein product [Heligmosomoides polygyrus]
MSHATGQLMSIHVGQCGNQIGQSFWKTLCDEHAIDGRGRMTCEESIRDNKDVFFYQADDDHYVPRAVLVDLEPRVINGIMTSESFSRLFNPDNVYMSTHGGGAGNNWASGYGQGGEVYEQIMDIIERESENSDQMDGFLFTHSVSGGTGSGMGSLILEKIRDSKISFLGSQRNPESDNHVVVIDNAALNRLAAGKFETQQPTFDHINSLVRIFTLSPHSEDYLKSLHIGGELIFLKCEANSWVLEQRSDNHEAHVNI